MNALVIAQHHGAFLTIQSLLGKVENIVVVVPQKQIEKYSSFPEPIFKQFLSNMQKFCKKNKVQCWVGNNVTTMADHRQLLGELKMTGKWVVLSAGSLYQQFDERKLVGYSTATVRGRMYDHDPRLAMYGMIGLHQKDEATHGSNYFLNLDMEVRERVMAPIAIARPDPLVGCALSSFECLMYRSRTAGAAILYFWMKSISQHLTETELMTYPLDEYAIYAKKVKKYLPDAAYEMILENGAQSAEYRDIANLQL